MQIDQLRTAAFKVPVESHKESDGTIEWTSTTLVVVEVEAGGEIGFGYTYADASAASVIRSTLAPVVLGRDPLTIERTWLEMIASVRNIGRGGIASMAISAVDNALWDLQAQLTQLPLFKLLGGAATESPLYGSGGFTSMPIRDLQKQMAAFVDQGLTRVKMKVGRDPLHDIARVRAVREAIGSRTELFVDANGAYTRKEALNLAFAFADQGVTWFEEPVPSEDVDGLRLLRDRAPASIEIAAGEYGHSPAAFLPLLDAVDVLQIDATRAEGFTGFKKAAALATAHGLPMSSHCAPSLHAHINAGVGGVRHLEYFFDHVRIETMLFDGVLKPLEGALRPDSTALGLGLQFKWDDAEKFLLPGTFAALRASSSNVDPGLGQDELLKHGFSPRQ